MANKDSKRRLPATESGLKPGDFPLGSLESRAAARSMLGAIALNDCICFPPDEPPELQLEAEVESARAVLCPLHGERFSNVAPAIFTANQFMRLAHLEPERWSWRSPQYRKAMDASFPSERWPAKRAEKPDGSVCYLLKDGTEIYWTGPPPEVFDCNTGKPVARLGPKGTLLPLLPKADDAD